MLENARPNGMLGNERNRFKYKQWIFQPTERQPRSYSFVCGVPSIDKFFTEEFRDYEELLMSKIYELTSDVIIAENLPPVAFISYANDAAVIEDNIKKVAPLPEGKWLKAYPAVKIAYLAVSQDSHQQGIGTDMLDITKLLFTSSENRTGCRIINVDAHNSEAAIRLYKKAGFIFANDNNTPENKPTKANFRMFFDLMGPWEYDHSLLQPISSSNFRH